MVAVCSAMDWIMVAIEYINYFHEGKKEVEISAVNYGKTPERFMGQKLFIFVQAVLFFYMLFPVIIICDIMSDERTCDAGLELLWEKREGMTKKKIARVLWSLILVPVLAGSLAVPGNVSADEGDWGWGGRGDDNQNWMPHGTADEWIRESMLADEVPADYKVNPDTQGKAEEGKYNDYFLETDIQTVRITIDENNLNYVLQNALDEPYVLADSVTIGDTTMQYCGFKTKGSYTLEHAYTDNRGSDRFSFTVNFGKFVKKKDFGETQNFYGCSKISFNNFFFDKSMMKEFFALKLMDEMGLPTPQYGLAKLYINDNYYGVYAMVEAMDESILQQYYGVDDDELSSYLCKPEGTHFIYEDLLEDDSPLWEEDEDTYEDVKDMLPTVMEWVRKLNCLYEGTDFDGKEIDVNSQDYINLLHEVYDVEEVVKYFAVHSWLCQLDNMFVGKKNFGLYVSQQGVATIVPWDYDLSFGCYYPSTAEATANFDIDIMYKPMANEPDGLYSKYPLFRVIYQNDTLLAKYHEYMAECSKVAALGGTVESTGKTYEPGYFNSFIEAMEEEVIDAATEELADNVYYMNRIRQPRDVKAALPNLAKIIAMRSVGVYNQVNGIESTVTGQGCDLSTLGNAVQGRASFIGTLSAVDATTGMFTTAEYSKGSAPTLKVLEMNDSHVKYTEILNAVGLKASEEITVYTLNTTGVPDTDYTLTIPLTKEQLKEGNVTVYSYCDEKVEKLKVDLEDNLCKTTLEDIQYIVIVPGGSFSAAAVILTVAVLAAAGLATVIILKIKKKNTDKKEVA